MLLCGDYLANAVTFFCANFQFSSWSYDKTGDAGLFVQDSNMKCQDSGFAVVLTFLPREMMFECRTHKHASRVYCCILCRCTDAQCVV